ncbi:PREDICTED: thioredoxin-like 1-3, chloroplastic isoform X2 [Tarenaya hassleriana]|uniref:thioredoxin-like 1-3, chloroplastic isoform X2 n=1 Tax=Tarenaya hassleriana TaxID=28532 RepID=UPI00053C14C6|nr:PREDICTED: thioredoxin-like 1-3, chloroplastic isoform X2 [Tarenaya hassleriana]
MARDMFIKLNPISININRPSFNPGENPGTVTTISPISISSPCSICPLSISQTCFRSQRALISRDNNLFPKKSSALVRCQTSLGIGRNHKWWEKEMQPNMKEVTSPEDLVGSLLNAGDRLVVVDFFSPGCGGCRALHPKIAEKNREVQFLQVNYEEHRSLCQSLNVHVLPFFRFYRGSSGRLCSFSCTNATIKKFKDALEKHGREQCSIGGTRGLEEKELITMAGKKDLSFYYKPELKGEIAENQETERSPRSPTLKELQKREEELKLSIAGR